MGIVVSQDGRSGINSMSDDNRVETAEYMNCGTDDERVDFFAFNDYSWCDPSTFTTSTWSLGFHRLRFLSGL